MALTRKADLELIRALRLTAEPPQAWIDAAALIPVSLGGLGAVEAMIADPVFHGRFHQDPEQALFAAGLPTTTPLVAAVRDSLE